MNTVQHLYGEFTRREMKVIDLIKASNSNRQIAEALSISQRTVENYISKIYFKTVFHQRGNPQAVNQRIFAHTRA